MAITTFRELEELESPPFEDLERLLKERADTGGTISGAAVSNIVDRITLTKDQKIALLSLACAGAIWQMRAGVPDEAREYAEVIVALSEHQG